MTDRLTRSPSLERILERRPSFSRPPVRTINSPKLTEDEALMLTSPFLGYRTSYTYARSNCYNSEETDSWEIPNLANNWLEVQDVMETEKGQSRHFGAPSLLRMIWMSITWIAEISYYCLSKSIRTIVVDVPISAGALFYQTIFTIFTSVIEIVSLVCCAVKTLTFGILGGVNSVISHITSGLIYFLQETRNNITKPVVWLRHLSETFIKQLIYSSQSTKQLICDTYSGASSGIGGLFSVFGQFILLIISSVYNTIRYFTFGTVSLLTFIANNIVGLAQYCKQGIGMGVIAISEAIIKQKRVSISDISQTLAFDIDSTPMSIIKGDAKLCATNSFNADERGAEKRRSFKRSRRIGVDSEDEDSGVITSTPSRGPRMRLRRRLDSGSENDEKAVSWSSYFIGLIAFVLFEFLRIVLTVFFRFYELIERTVNKIHNDGTDFVNYGFEALNNVRFRVMSLTSVITACSSSCMTVVCSMASASKGKKFWILLFLLLIPFFLFLLSFRQDDEEKIVTSSYADDVYKYKGYMTSQIDLTQLKIGMYERFTNAVHAIEHFFQFCWSSLISFRDLIASYIFNIWNYTIGVIADVGVRNPFVFFSEFLPIYLCQRDHTTVPIVANKVEQQPSSVPVAPVVPSIRIQEDSESMNKIKTELQAELEARLNIFEKSYQQQIEELKTQKNGAEYDYSELASLIRQSIYQYDIDKTGLFDFALESAGASVISTRCSESYDSYSRLEKIWNIPLWYSSYGPRTVIQRNSNSLFPGECWCFKTGKGYLTISLSHGIKISSISYEHIGKNQTPDGELRSSPKKLKFWAYQSENDLNSRVLLGEYEYKTDQPPLQFFIVKNSPPFPVKIVELETVSNYGAEFTCLYRLRVHGQVYKED